eukprot:g14357.t1
MGPHGTFQFVEEKLGLSQDGPQQCSRNRNTARSSDSSSSSSSDTSGEPFPVTSATQRSTSSVARRNKVYDNIMRQWEKAASSMVPMPRSSHRRVLRGQALPTRQRGESFSLEASGSSVKPSWGNLSDTVSPAVQLAWREQLLRLKLSRLAGVPMTVLLRQLRVRGAPGSGAAEACRMVATSQGLSAELTALAMIEGTCPEVRLRASSSLSRGATGGPAEGARGSDGGGGKGCEATERQQPQPPQPQRQQDKVTVASREEPEEVVEAERQNRVASENSCASTPAASMSSGSSYGGRRRVTAPLLPAKPPVRGFHLVDLHAVVRNSVEWRQCLPKVEPCFRVSSNRDSVLLGLVHALGGRLSCSSAHDITAGVDAARRASPVPAPPPRLFDRHVCRSPSLLRASVAAGVQLYEVDSADEWARIGAARRRQELSNRARLRDEVVGATFPHPQTTGMGPAGVVVRLAMPFRWTRQEPDGSAAASTVADFSGVVEASYGAREEDLVEIVHTAMADTAGPECGGGEKHSMSSTTSFSSGGGGGGGGSSPLPIVGFSIDVGAACWDDALAGHASVPRPSGQRRPEASCATPDAATDATGLVPGEAVPSASLSESIDAAVAFAVKMAAVATAAATPAASTTSTTPPWESETSKQGENEFLNVANGTSAPGSATTTTAAATLRSLASSPFPFSFRRLHVTGLGEGGARGEPLAALKTSLSKHLPPTVAAAVTATSGDGIGGGSRDERASRSSTPVGRPVLVSADATEHLVAGGVWSTVASIIGRKSVPPAAVEHECSTERSLAAQLPTKDGVVGGSAGSHGVADTGAEVCCDAGDGLGEGASTPAGPSAGGTMYYIDDGCYGSLSGALLRGVQMQPLPLRVTAAAGEKKSFCRDEEGGTATAQELPCTVWGPTCDGLDCVCRTTPLPEDLEPGRDWLFFPDVGIRGGVDATDFNGLKPLDLFYCVREREEIAPSRTTASALPPKVSRQQAAGWARMMGLLPLWVLLTWMVFPILALAAETASVGKLRPWPETTVSAPGYDGDSWSWDRPAWRDGRPVPGRILFVSVGFYGHAMPLLSLAEEMAARGHNVTFGTHNCLRRVVDETPGVAFLSAGRMPMHDHHLRSKLRSLSQAGGFWGLLTLLNDVYLPLARPMYRALLSAVQPPAPSQPPLSSPSSSSSAPPRNGAAPSGETTSASEETANSRIPSELDTGQPPPRGDGGSHCCASSGDGGCGNGSGSGSGEASIEEGGGDQSCSLGGGSGSGNAVSGENGAGGAETGEAVCGRGGGSPLSESSCGRPFDLVVLDMGSLGGLDFAQKLGIPYMFNSPSLLFDLSGRHVTATLPAWGTGLARRMNLGDRLQNAISPRALSVFLTPAFIAMNKARREHGLEPFYAQDDVFHGARVLVNTAFGFEYPHDLGPLVEMTGPLLPPRIARALSAAAVPPPLPRSSRGIFSESQDADGVNSDSTASGGKGGWGGGSGVDEDDDPLALPFLIRTWLGGTGALVAPGTAAFEAAAKQAVSAKQRAEAAAAAAAAATTTTGVSGKEAAATSDAEGSLLPADNGVIYVNLGRMPQLDKWQLVTILQALSSPSEAMCWGGGDAEDRLGPYRILWVLPAEQREQLLSALLPMAPPPSFRLKVLGGLPHLGILAHPAVKAVVSHCGMGAAQEALVFGKPILCLPMLADQEDVAKRVVDAGVGLGLSGLPKGNISSGDIRNAVANVVSYPSFRGSAAVLSGVLRRAGGTLRAADVVEGTLQLGGSSYLHPPELRGPWHETSGTDAYVYLAAGVVLVAVLGYALLAALCYGVLLFLRFAAKTVVRSIRWLLRLHLHIPCIGFRGARWGKSPPDPLAANGSNGSGTRDSGSVEKVLLSPEKAAAAAAAAAAKMAMAGGGGLWDEALMTLLGGPDPPDPFPEDSLPELDGPAIDRQSAPGVGGRNGRNSGGGGGDGRSGAGGGGVGGGNGHLRSLSGELVVWPTAPNDGRTFDFRGWSNGAGNGSNGGGYGNGNGNEVSPHQMKRWD